MGVVERDQTAAEGTVSKALHVLDLVAEMKRPVRFNDVLDVSPYPKATLYRLLQTLTQQGMLSYHDTHQTYAPGIRLVRLAHDAWSQSSLAPLARPHIESLAEATGEAIHLTQIDNGQVIFVDKLRVTDRFETLAQVGMVAPAYCTGVGKAMLAFMAPARLDIALRQQSYFAFTPTTHTDRASLMAELETIRTDRFAYDREEHEVGIISLATPILSTQGRIIGAVSVATSTTRYDLAGLDQFKNVLLDTAEKVGRDATPWQFPG